MGTHILVVDDDGVTCENLRFVLELEGYSVAIAHDCRTAKAMAHEEKPDLALLDVGLPDGNGLELGRGLRDELAMPLMFVTPHTEEAELAQGLELGAEDYITKPFDGRELLECVRMALWRSGHNRLD